MAGSSFGRALVVTTAGESHGPANLVIVDGCPPGIELDEGDLRRDLERRRPGQSQLVSQRREDDVPQILSGVFEGRTTGTSIAVLIANADARSGAYDDLRDRLRPGHADHGYLAKFGHRDHRGGGRASARETTARVAAGAIARKILQDGCGAEVVAYVRQVGDVVADIADPSSVTRAAVDHLPDGSPNWVRCPDPVAAARMAELIEQVRSERDSIGGIAEVVAQPLPAGLGEPVFDKLEAELGKALLSVPAVMGVEYGVGFGCARLRGSELNDPFVVGDEGRIVTESNRHGGILGGISSGMPLILRVAVKPTSSIPREQRTVTSQGAPTTVTVGGRHDPCVLPRFVPIAEAMVALVLADHWLRWRGQTGLSS